MSDTPKYSHDHVFAAMCIWEEIVHPNIPDAGEPWKDLWDQVGASEMRELVIRNLAAQCDAAWTKAYKLWEDREVHHHDECEAGGGTGVCTCKAGQDHMADEPGPFDWEFVPTWLRVAVDWSDLQNGPRVLGS